MPDAASPRPGDVAAPDARSIAHEVARVLTVPKGPRRFVRASIPMTIATTGGGIPVLGAPGIIHRLGFAFDSLVTVPAGGGVGLLTLRDGNRQEIYELPIQVASSGAAFLPQIMDTGTIDFGFAGGVLANWAIVAGQFTTGSISVMLIYESIPIGQGVSDGLPRY